ncbi:MAG: NADH-quinone oxidoreductase subunit C [Granulosicoccaceae bacterium]
MSVTAEPKAQSLLERLQQALPAEVIDAANAQECVDMLCIDIAPDNLLDTLQVLHDDPTLSFKQMSDLCGVDYATFGETEWSTETGGSASFSRAVDANSIGTLSFSNNTGLPNSDQPRFAAVYHLLSLDHNVRLRIRCHAVDNDFPIVPSVTAQYACADWYEREAFDLYGILFDGHNDLRRILTDYGFVGHPFRKDFPLIGNVEMRFDPIKKRVVYEPVSIEPRVLVPRVIREDSRYARDVPAIGGSNADDAAEAS